jgi:hypothetical protein
MGQLCTTAQALVLGSPDCAIKVGAVKGFLLSKTKQTLTAAQANDITYLNTQLASGAMMLLKGMQQRDAANQAAVTGTLAYGYTEELRGVILTDNFVFPQDICEQKNAVSLIGFKGYAFAITDTGQLVGFRTVDNSGIQQYPISVTAMDTTGAYADTANIQTDTLTIESGEVKRFVNNRIVVGIDYNVDDLTQPYKLSVTGTATTVSIFDDCNMQPVNAPAGDISVTATVNGIDNAVDVISVSGNVARIEFSKEPVSGQAVTLAVTLAKSGTTYGVSEPYSFVVV